MMNSRPTRKPEGRGPFLKLRRMIAGVAASKPFLITVSALAAVVCWSALVASDGTDAAEDIRQRRRHGDGRGGAQESRIHRDGRHPEKVPAVKMTVE
ncbi:MAG: hypothetical protein ACLUI3_16700 [Christensenellales bacterium]